MSSASLTKYQKKRDFGATPEPRGRKRNSKSKGFSFVVQQHAARRLHFDFRLELDGVLKSWAVPKGPSYNAANKRLAVQTEDHPIDYAEFEGVIPPGQYGAGTVMVWDHGTWQPESSDPVRDLEKGRLTFELHGKKLKGRWHLVRGGGGSDKPMWLLMKSRDAYAQPPSVPEVIELAPLSVVSGRDMQEIAGNPERTWQSNRTPAARSSSIERAKTRARETVASRVRITHPERILYPEQGISKVELARYYARIEDWILPHVTNRPLTLVRCPEGRHKHCFFQKHRKSDMPSAIEGVEIEEDTGKRATYISVVDIEGVVALVQLGTLELHTWGARTDNPERPDQLVFDLDPGENVDFGWVIDGAHRLRELLTELDLASFVKTTGGKGLHVVVPIQRRIDWDAAKSFCRGVAERLSRGEPKRYITSMSKSRRRGRIFVDYLRNTRGATSVCAYSTRARAGAPVSAPLTWDELSPEIRPDQFDVRTMPERLSSLKHDPWQEFFEVRQSITQAMRRNIAA
jgi:bifunctional non-homologous end joining protein LigD